jgi:hypothetical protein
MQSQRSSSSSRRVNRRVRQPLPLVRRRTARVDTIPSFPSPQQVYSFSRRCADLIVSTPLIVGQFATTGPPSWSGVPFITVNPAGTADPLAGLQTYSTNFYMTLSMQSLPIFADLQNLFQEYRIRGVRLEVQLLNSPFATLTPLGGTPPSGAGIFAPTPEIVLVRNDTGSNVPLTAIQVNQYQGSQRFVLDDQRPHVFKGVPKISALVQGSSSAEFAIPQSNTGMWLNWAASPDVPHYLFDGLISNFFGSNAPNNMLIRFSATVVFDCRRPY